MSRDKILEHHFATTKPEEFRANLEKFCPELFFEQEEEQTNGNDNSLLSGENERPQPPERQLDLLTHEEIYQKAKEDSKIEIAMLCVPFV